MGASKGLERLKAIQMHCIDGKSFAEIARELDVRDNTVSQWIKDFKKRLEFDEDLNAVESLIKNENSIPFLTRVEINDRLKRIKAVSKVIHYKFFN